MVGVGMVLARSDHGQYHHHPITPGAVEVIYTQVSADTSQELHVGHLETGQISGYLRGY